MSTAPPTHDTTLDAVFTTLAATLARIAALLDHQHTDGQEVQDASSQTPTPLSSLPS